MAIHYRNIALINDPWGCYKTNAAVIYCNFRISYVVIFVTLNFACNACKLKGYYSKLPQYFNPRTRRVKITEVIY